MEDRCQVFLIFRHGARYSIDKPIHNVLWPRDDYFWNKHKGNLTPVGVIQLYNFGNYFKTKYPWVNNYNINVNSTKKSRAIESAWSFLLGLLPENSIQIKCLGDGNQYNRDKHNGENEETVYIKYFSNNDLIFGNYLMDQDRFIRNIRSSTNLNNLKYDERVHNLIDKVNRKGYSFNKNDVTDIAKLKELYAQIQVDEQLNVPYQDTIIGKYDLNDDDVDIIVEIGLEVISRRSVPSSDNLEDKSMTDMGRYVLHHIKNKMERWDYEDEFNILSCHDSTIISLASNLGLKVNSPEFCGYFLMERSYLDNSVKIYYCQCPFDDEHVKDLRCKVWNKHSERDFYMDWNELLEGKFDTENFINVLDETIL